jgi:hypothetical protein
MMATLIDWYPGDRILDLVLIIALGVALLSSAAWAVSWHLSRKPATRHLVLVSAMICCLAMPVLAWVFAVSGFSLITIPLLSASSAEREWGITQRREVDARTFLGDSPLGPNFGRNGRFTPPDPPLLSLSFLKKWLHGWCS